MSQALTFRGLDWGICGSYLLLVFVIAWWSGRRKKTVASDYFLAGGSLPWWIIGSSMVMACLSTEQMVGENGASYKYGFCIAQWDAYMLPPVTMMVWIFLPIYLRKRVRTIPEFLSMRYGETLRDIFSVITVVSYTLVFVAMVLFTGSVLFSSLFPLRVIVHGQEYTTYAWSLFLIIVTMLYITWGGLASVVWTDCLHFLVMCLAGGAIFYLGMRIIDGGSDIGVVWRGWDKFRSTQADRFHLIQPANHPIVPWPALFMRVVTTQLYYNCANQFIVQKTLAARSDWHARMGALVFASVGFVLPFVDIFPGMIAYHLNPKLPDPNQALAFVFRQTLPIGTGIRGLVLAGMTAAILSTLGSLINAASTIFTLDIYKRRINPEASDLRLMKVGRWTCLAVTGIALIWTPVVGKYDLIFTYFQSFVAYVAAPSGAIFLLGVFWRRASHKAAVSAILVSLPICVALEIIGKLNHRLSISFIYISFIGWVISMVIMVVVSLRDRPPDYERIRDLLWNTSSLREPSDNGRLRPWYQSLWFWYIAFAVAWFWLLLRFW